MSGCVGSTDIATDNRMVMINEIVAAMRIYRQFSAPNKDSDSHCGTPVATRQVYSMYATRHTLRLSVDLMDRP